MAESLTRYQQIAQDLEHKISTGIYPVGSVLPTEIELCDAYGVSRFTVRAALQELKDLCLVSRRKNSGTRVEAASRRGRFRASPASLEELAEYGATHLRTVELVEAISASPALADELECAVGQAWLRFGIMRRWDVDERLPSAWTDVYVDPRYSDVAEQVRQRPQVLTSNLIEEMYDCKISRVEQHIQAVTVRGRLARLLKMEPGDPAMKILRRYVDEGQGVIEVSVTVHPADRYRHSTQLHRSSA